MNSRLLLVIVAVVLVAVGAGWMMTQQEAETPAITMPVGAPSASPSVTETNIEIKDMALGNPMAKVQVIEYASFTCPHCAAFHTNAFEDLKKSYIDTGKIRFIFREVYFDQFGLVASVIGRCSGNTDDYFSFVDKVFTEQQQWMASRDGNTILNELVAIGKSTGLTDEQLQACLSDDAKSAALLNAYQTNAKADGIRSTPSFIVNGKLMLNSSFETFSQVLDKELGL